MALVPNFTTAQTVGLPEDITLTDTSQGLDSDIFERRVYFQVSDGSYLVESGTTTDYEIWPYADQSETFDVLDQDEAIDVRVDWVNSVGTVLYTKTILSGFTLFNETFDYGLTQMLAGNPLLINDNNFFFNKMSLRVYIDSGNNAITLASDITSAQLCYDKATELRLSSPYSFNSN